MKCSRIVVAALLAGPFLWLFGSLLFEGRSFGFRDSAYYYYPLFEWTAAQWGEGRVPLWNPLDNCGTPVVADSTSSIFYPGKLVFALPFAFLWRFKLYVLLHAGLAALAAFLVARRWHASWNAAGVCAMSYALGGYVLFQHCNIVFLVSAAWLPFAVLFAERMLAKRSFAFALAFGCTLALMVLGGDPQTAYHAGLVAALYALLLWRRERRLAKAGGRKLSSAERRLSLTLARSRFLLLACAAGTGGLLAAVQILPSLQWSQSSQRAVYEKPRNVYEAAALLARDQSEDRGLARDKWKDVRRGILGRPAAGTHHDHLYQFSLGPWRLAEMVWPNVSGKMYPRNRRWTNVIPAEDRIWTPSLYVGLLPMLLGLSALRLRRGKVREQWLSWSAILATVASFGWFGIGWLLQELRVGALNADPNALSIGEPVGGLYWLMVVFLPGYAYFRFPAKLLVIASLALSLLAARGWDRAMLRPAKCLFLTLIALGSISVLALVFLFAGASSWYSWVSAAPGDDIWGPLDADGAIRDLRFSLATTFLVSLICFWLLHVRRFNNGSLAKYIPTLLLIVTAADIAIANRWMIATVDDQHVTETVAVAKLVSESKPSSLGIGKSRIHRGNPDRWVPPNWRRDGSDNRIAENYVWQRSTLFPRHHLPFQFAYASSPGTIMPMDYMTMLGVASDHGMRRPDEISEPHPAILDGLSVEYLLLPGGIRFPGHEPVTFSASRPLPDDFSVWHNPNSFPRCWIVRDVEVRSPVDSQSPRNIAGRTHDILFPGGQVRDLRRTAVVESEQPPAALADLARPANTVGEECELILEEPRRIEFQAKLNSPALVVLNDYFYPGWTATLEDVKGGNSAQVEILRTNRTMRGVLLPKGEHHVVFAYQPIGFRVGAVVSGLAWLAVGVATALFLLRSQRRRTKKAI